MLIHSRVVLDSSDTHCLEIMPNFVVTFQYHLVVNIPSLTQAQDVGFPASPSTSAKYRSNLRGFSLIVPFSFKIPLNPQGVISSQASLLLDDE